MLDGADQVEDDSGDDEPQVEPPMRRSTVLTLVALIALLPICAVIAIVIAATRDEPARTTAVLNIGSCVEIADNGDITDVECPQGNGRVMAVRQSSADCPAGTSWAILRDSQIFCIERTRRDTDTNDTAPATAPPATFVACEPVPRFRLDGIEYENIRFSDVVAEADLGEVVGSIEVHPTAFDRCEPFIVLKDGEGSWPAGTQIYAINGVDPTLSLAAQLGGGVYLRFDAVALPPNA